MSTPDSTGFDSSLSRREFLQRAGAVVIAGALGSLHETPASAAPDATKREHQILVGSNIYGWGQYYQRMNKNVNASLEEVMSALRDAGYDYLEGFLDTGHPENNAGFAEKLRAKGLRPVAIYTGARLHEAGKANEVVNKLLAAARVCKELGYEVIDCNPDPIGRAKTAEELTVQAKALDELGAGLKQLGLRFGVHNHTPEMANHAHEFHHDLRQTNPALVGLCYDVHWVFRGGIGPAEVLKEYGGRVVSWHLRQSREKVWWEDLDTGEVDYEIVARYAKENHLTAPYTVELALEPGTKISRSVVENHRRSREFVRKVFAV